MRKPVSDVDAEVNAPRGSQSGFQSLREFCANGFFFPSKKFTMVLFAVLMESFVHSHPECPYSKLRNPKELPDTIATDSSSLLCLSWLSTVEPPKQNPGNVW